MIPVAGDPSRSEAEMTETSTYRLRRRPPDRYTFVPLLPADFARRSVEGKCLALLDHSRSLQWDDRGAASQCSALRSLP